MMAVSLREATSMHILLALDGSPSAVHARDLVASLPWPAGTSVTLLTAYQVPAAWFPEAGMAGGWITGAEDALRTEAVDALAAMAVPLEGHGWTIDRKVVLGRPATVIREVADAVDADVIVMGSRGHGRIESMLLGSVSAEVADLARQSVLVARGGRVARALVATDGSECAAAIPDRLAAWQVLRGVPAVVLSVAPVSSPAFELMVKLYTLGSETLEGQEEQLLARYRGHADELAARLSAIGIPTDVEVRAGDAAHEIVKAAAERHADLIVTGSRCLHGLDRLLLGSVARNVVQHAHASVLIVRPQGAHAG
jgi:nucleotide-binding universal stress UspA family protein